MFSKLVPLLLAALLALPIAVSADDLTRMVQEDLVTLGYDPGNTTGEAVTKTVVAVSKFQAEHDLDVTGEITPQLAGVIKASIKERNQPVQAAATAQVAPEQRSDGDLYAAQQACLRMKYETQQASAKKKRGFGSLMRAVSRTAAQIGGRGISQTIARTSADIYGANATAADIQSAAKDLGLSEDDIEECRIR